MVDTNRISRLAQLAGLKLSAAETDALSADLASIEKFATGLLVKCPDPEDSSQNRSSDGCAEEAHRQEASLDFDRPMVEKNAPAMVEGFFLVPAVDTSEPGENS